MYDDINKWINENQEMQAKKILIESANNLQQLKAFDVSSFIVSVQSNILLLWQENQKLKDEIKQLKENINLINNNK